MTSFPYFVHFPLELQAAVAEQLPPRDVIHLAMVDQTRRDLLQPQVKAAKQLLLKEEERRFKALYEHDIAYILRNFWTEEWVVIESPVLEEIQGLDVGKKIMEALQTLPGGEGTLRVVPSSLTFCLREAFGIGTGREERAGTPSLTDEEWRRVAKCIVDIRNLALESLDALRRNLLPALLRPKVARALGITSPLLWQPPSNGKGVTYSCLTLFMWILAYLAANGALSADGKSVARCTFSEKGGIVTIPPTSWLFMTTPHALEEVLRDVDLNGSGSLPAEKFLTGFVYDFQVHSQGEPLRDEVLRLLSREAKELRLLLFSLGNRKNVDETFWKVLFSLYD